MFEEDFGPFGVLFYIIIMLLVFAIPIAVGFFSGWIAMLRRKIRIGMLLWSVILFSPDIFILIMGMINNKPGFIGQTLVQEPLYSLTIISYTLPFVIPLWILGTAILYHAYYAHQKRALLDIK